MADKICGDGIGNSTGRLYTAEVDLITPSTMYGSSPGEPRTLVQPADSAGPKKKPTSFQITSVTVQGSRLSNDGGDESADDLDESHTEDQNSDILDCSKTTDLDNDQLSPTEETGAATGVTVAVTDEPAADPVAVPSDAVPSSSFTSVTMSPAVVSTGGALTIVTSAPANSGSGAAPDVPINPDHWQRRFKVVKIVSSEPFGRGRWLCMDFVDPPAMQGDAKPGDDREAVAAADLPPAVSNEAVAHVYEIPVGQTYPANSQQSGPLYGIILPVTSNVQGTPLSVLQPISEQPPEPSQTAPSDAGPTGPTEPATDPVPENVNKSATEEDSESTSAGSTVAIDNKIEQAMDLVKSHLMFAVREEVDVLKEKITELLDRISQLEYENGILRAGATPETLSLLSQPAQPQQASQQASQQPMVLPQPVLAQPQVLAQPVTIQQTAATQPQQAAAVAAPTLQQQQQSLQQQPT